MARTKDNRVTLTTAQQLGSLIKSARDIMRKDKGLSGDLDRLPMLTWIMFLKFLDDMERIREQEAIMEGLSFRPAIEPPYRWRDWAAGPTALTGDELTAFVNNDEAVRPDGVRGPGLFAYLRSLQGANGGDRRDVIATVFRGTVNRMTSGYLLREVAEKIDGIHFTSSDEIHTLGHLYESMLREMRDAAGDSGEFYTPRAVVRFMVEVTDPRLGETVLDPACGTGGFLVESYSHLEKQCYTVEDREVLQTRSLLGGEPLAGTTRRSDNQQDLGQTWFNGNRRRGSRWLCGIRRVSHIRVGSDPGSPKMATLAHEDAGILDPLRCALPWDQRQEPHKA